MTIDTLYIVCIDSGKISEACKDLLLDTTFATLTNVNFDSTRFLDYLRQTNAVRNELKAEAARLGVDPSTLKGPANFEYSDDKDFLMLEAKLQGVLQRKARMADDNAMVVREMAMYGIKGETIITTCEYIVKSYIYIHT